MDEMAYRRFWDKAKKADAIYEQLRELYGHDLPNDKLFMRARVDGVITGEERQLLREFRSSF